MILRDGGDLVSDRVLAIDLGGTRVKAALVRDGAVDGVVEVRPAPSDRDGALAVIRGLGDDLLGTEIPAAVGLAVPGLVTREGRIQALPGKYAGIEGFDLPGWVRSEFGAAATVTNDAVAYALGEARLGAGRGAARVLVVTLGTGVGVGVINDGQPVTSGPFGGGIMGGNVLISEEDGAFFDTAGRAGTVEARCRADRIVDYAVAAGGSYRDVAEVLAAYAADEPAAVEGLRVYRDWLGRALGALAVAHGVERVVVGGGPVRAGGPVLDGVDDHVRRLAWPTHEVAVVPAALGDAAALLGIGDLAVTRT
jgi:glucokinase